MLKKFIVRLIILLQYVLVFALSACDNTGSIAVYNLHCENLINPLGIDKTVPRFSWKIKSNKNGTEQKAFQLLVANDTSKFEKDNSDLWDSGKVETSSSIWVTYDGKSLNPGTLSYWKVRVWDESGNVSPWSAVSEFSIGLLNENDWHAEYIGLPSEAGFSDCPQLRKSFNLDNVGKRMLLHVNSLGYHEVYLNGEKVGEGVLTPAVSQFDKRSLAITYDVSSFVKEGSNDLLLWLGSGWYSEKYPGVTNEGPVVKAQLERVSDFIREIVLVTDSSWVGRSSEYTRVGHWRSGHYGGEQINGATVNNGFSFTGNSSKTWLPVSEVSIPDHIVSPQMVEQNKIVQTIKPVKVITLSDKSFLVDMGQNLTGWFEINFTNLKKSQEVIMEYCDHLDKNGQFVDQKQIDKYIASGKGQEIFKNKFNYHGFRYIRISNLDQAPYPDSMKAYLIHTDYEMAAGFECSDHELNEIHDLIYYTLRCLSLGGYIVDCPQLERLGYGGDGNACTPTAQSMFNLSPLYNNWLQAWGDCMRENGDLPHTAPNPIAAGGGPYWCGFIITATWNTYLNYGDPAILEKYYPFMKRWLGFVEENSVDGLLKKWADTDYRAWFLGDWASPEGVDQTAEASVDIVTNSFVSVCYDDMQKIAKLLGKESDARLYTYKRDQLKSKIHKTFFNSAKNSYATGSQIDLTYPLLANIVPDRLLEPVANTLENTIIQKYDGHFACGLVGIPVFTDWAIKNHKPDLMYSMLKKKDYPGYLYMIDNGATTTWEHWNGNRSRIHNCYNGIGSWFYQALGGIRPAVNVSAYQQVIIDPQIPKGITWAKTSKETPYGTLIVNWEFIGGTFEMDFEIPVGVEAEVIIPSSVKKYIFEGETYVILGEKESGLKVKSGKYKIQYSL